MDRSFALFRDSLLESLKDVTYTNEIDMIVDTFLYAVLDHYRFDCAEVYLTSGESIILRGIAGMDRYYVCKVYQNANEEPFRRTLESSEMYIGANVNNASFPEFDAFAEMMILPIGIFKKNFGAFVVRMRAQGSDTFLRDNVWQMQNLLAHFAIYTNTVLETFTANENGKRVIRLKEMETRFETTKEADSLFDTIAYEIAYVFQAEGAIVRVFDVERNAYVVRSVYGVDARSIVEAIPEDDEYIARAKREDGFFYVNTLETSPLRAQFRLNAHSMMTALLRAFDQVFGFATLLNRVPSATNPLGHFVEEDRALFKNFGFQTAGRLYREQMLTVLEGYVDKIDKANRKLYILYEVTNALLGQSKLEDILFILLTSATIGEAFGFNRAFLYLYDEKEAVFRGKMGVAPINSEDAYKIWNEIKRNRHEASLMEMILVALSEKEINENIELNFHLQSSTIPADDRCPVFHKAFSEREAVNVIDPSSPEVNVRNYTDLFGDVPFAAIPVISQKRFIGLLVVDNPYNGQPIYTRDLSFLKMFANQTGIAIEYSFLYAEIEQRNRELKSTQMKLNEAQRLALIGEMSASVSHDLRNSIISIGGFASRLTRIQGLDERAKKYATIIAEEVVKLEDYLRRNLSFAKKINLNIEEVRVDKMFEVMSLLTADRISSSAKSIALHVDILNAPETIECDYAQMHDSILNLVINAIDAVPETDAELYLIARACAEADMCEIEIKNTMSYIPPKELVRIFDPFYTTKSRGVGLGLGTAKRIVEAHGGEIIAASAKGEDGAPSTTSFTITIPIRQDHEKESSEDE